MKIRTTHDPKPIPNREFDWSAIDESTYDGAEDSSTRGMVGYGATEGEAIEDLLRLHRERAEYREDMAMAEAERRDAEARELMRDVRKLCGWPEDEFVTGGMCFGPKP